MDTNTIITCQNGWMLQSCDTDVERFTVSPDIPSGFRVEDPDSEETIAKVKTALAAEALVLDIQQAVKLGKPSFDVREWLGDTPEV